MPEKLALSLYGVPVPDYAEAAVRAHDISRGSAWHAADRDRWLVALRVAGIDEADMIEAWFQHDNRDGKRRYAFTGDFPA